MIALAFLVALTAWSGPRVDGLEGFVALYLVWITAQILSPSAAARPRRAAGGRRLNQDRRSAP